MSTLFHSTGINLDTKESAFKFPLSLYYCYASLTHLLETNNTEIQFKEKLILEKTAPSQPVPLKYSPIARRVIFPAEHTLLTTYVQTVLSS